MVPFVPRRFWSTPLLALGAAVLLAGSAAWAQPAAAGGEPPLRPGDAVIVKLPGDSVVNDLLYVELDGSLAVPRVGRVVVDQVPAREVPALLRRALAQVARGSEAVVRPMRRVTVVGEVGKPGVMHMDLGSTVRDAVAQAGALGDFADVRRISLVRAGQERRIAAWQTAEGGATPLESGDVIAVPREGWLRRNLLGASTSVLLLVTTLITVTR